MAVHFKFRSAVEFDSVELEDPSISVFHLKQKIAEHKNLKKCEDFDLVITNAQTGEVYNDDEMLVPKDTSVIIKRVPSAGPKPTVVLSNIESLVEASSSKNTNKDDILGPPTSFNADADAFDDFGVDLYAVSEQCFPKSDIEERNKVPGIVNKEDVASQRQPQRSQSGGRILEKGDFKMALSGSEDFGGPIPPLGYVCHRCGKQGHFIKYCSTNGDAACDIKGTKVPLCLPKTKLKEGQECLYNIPYGSVAVMQPDEIVFSKEAGAILMVPNGEPPSELRCSLCKAIFREAVMIPCCQHSFCNECIQQALIEKGKCPQCASTKFKKDNLLPNIALRQAIEHFLESQITISRVDNCAAKHAPDVESAILVKTSSHALSRIQGGPQASQSPSATVGATVKESNQVIVESTGLSEGRKSIVDNGEGGKVSKVPQLLSHKEQGVTMQSEVSKGKRKRKPSRMPAADGAANFMAFSKGKKGDRCCYLCGSPEHLAKDCMESSIPYPQHGTFCAGGPMYPGSIPAYGPDAYWHGPSVPHIRPFPNMYGAAPAAMPFEAPMVPIAPYAVPPYMPSMYPGVPFHCGFVRMGGIGAAVMTPGERPLSREEFMELQERERWRRLMQEQQDRERVQKANSAEGESRVHYLETQKRFHDQRWGSVDEQHILYHKREADRDSVGNYSDESDYQKSRSAKHIKSYSREKYSDSNACQRRDSLSEDEENASFNDKGGKNLHPERWCGYSKAIKSNSRKDSRHYHEDIVGRSSSELEEDNLNQSYSAKSHQNMLRESDYMKPGKQCSSKKHSEGRILHSESASRSNSYISCHRSRRGPSEDRKQASCHERNAKKYENLEHHEEEVSHHSYYTDPDEKRLEGKLREVEMHKRSHYKKHKSSKSKSDPFVLGGESKRRKKYRKHGGNGQDRIRDGKSDVDNDPEMHTARHSKQKLKSYSQQTMSTEDSIDETRWRMHMGLGIEDEDVSYLYPSSHKLDDSYT